MARKVYFLIWILSAAAIGFLAFMPDSMGRGIYAVIFPRNFYWANLNTMQFLVHAGFFFFNSVFLLLFFNSFRQAGEAVKFMAVFVWVAALTVFSEAGQMYFLPENYNRTGLNFQDAIANFVGFFAAWFFYLFFIKLVHGSRRLKRNRY